MDWLTLVFGTFLLIFMSGDPVAAARKKIRIHVPEKVMHIHHYKKVFITQMQTQPTPLYTERNEATQQYAPGFLGTESVPTLAVVPLSERTESTVTPNLQPLYRARGHYGPTPVYRKLKPRRPKTRPSTAKRVKILTIEPRKKTYSKLKKTKRIIIRDEPRFKDNKDASTSHSYQNDFYLDGRPKVKSFKKGRKPNRVEKFVDGDTEHIHTYSEEHVHQIVYDNPPEGGKQEGLEAAALAHGSVPFYSNAASLPPPHTLLPLDVAIHHAMHSPPMQHLTPTNTPMRHPILPLRLHPSVSTLAHPVFPGSFEPAYQEGILESMSHPIQASIQVGSRPSDSLHGTPLPHHFENMNLASISSVGSLGTPAHMEYMDYNPREASHKHHYHEHGNDNPNFGSNKLPPAHPTKANDAKINPVQIHTAKHHTPQSNIGSWAPQENTSKGTELNENYQPFDVLKENYHSKHAPNDEEIIIASDLGFGEQTSDRPPYSGFTHVRNEKRKKPKAEPIARIIINTNGKKKTKANKILLHLAIDNKPSSTPTPFVEGDSYSGEKNNGFRGLAKSSSHLHRHKKPGGISFSESQRDVSTSDDYSNKENEPFSGHQRKKKPKKSISVQNINFGGSDHKSIIDHFAEGSNMSPTIHARLNNAAKRVSPEDLKYSPEDHHNYRTINGYDDANQVPEASNTNIQIVEAPSLRTMQTTNYPEIMETTTLTVTNTTTNVLTTTTNQPRKHRKKSAESKSEKSKASVTKQIQKNEKRTSIPQTSYVNTRGMFKYGDRVNERYDYEYDNLMFA